MIDFPSSMIPAMPSQCLPRTFSSRLSNTCSSRAIWPCVSLRWLSNAARSLGFVAAFASFGRAFVSCFSASYESRNSSMKASWSVPASAMVESPQLSGFCRRVSSYAWRIGLSGEVAMCGDGGDEVVRPRALVRRGNESRVRRAIGYRVDPAGAKQLCARTQRENRLAMAVLVLDEFEGPSISAKRGDGFVAIGEHQRVVEHGRRRLQADVNVDGIAVDRPHRA